MMPLRTERLILRNWRESDRDLFHRINSDAQVMEFFVTRRNRAESDEMMDRLASGIERNGFGLAAIELAESGEAVGFCGLHRIAGIPGEADGGIEIGWRLAPEFWGKGIVTEAARRWRDYGFDVVGLARIISFAVAGNHRSISVMRRIGMTARPDRDFDHPMVPDTHPQLRRHVFHEMLAGDPRP